MGGHLLHHWNLPEKRLSRADFDEVARLVQDKLQASYPERRVELLRFFAEKESFGDMDVAFESLEGDKFELAAELQSMFSYKPHKNGNCISFPVNGFQVDVLLFERNCFDIAQVYYAFESGNFMGRIADQMGLSYGHRGLYLQVPLSYFDPSLPAHQYKDMLISRDPQVIFDYLGFDYAKHVAGFRNFEEMSQWVADSRYFSPQVFAFDALNSINRTRNRKRPVYAAFVEWCMKQPAREPLLSKAEMIDKILAENEHVQAAMKEARAELVLNAERRAKFNGNLVCELRGLVAGPELGKFIVDFKKKIGNMDEWLDSQSADQVKQAILNFEK